MPPIEGLIAATYTPFDAAGEVNVHVIPRIVEHLLDDGVSGLFTCGSTGEGMSLTTAERCAVTEAYVEAASRRVPVIAHVGHESIAEARALATHAATAGADAISATCPSYYGIDEVDVLVEVAAEIAAAAPELPFYYYNIPVFTGVNIDMVEFLQRAGHRIPNLAGLKFTKPALHEFQACQALDDGRFEVLWGCDEMWLGALATGARGAVGSTYNVAAPLYRRITEAFDAGDVELARRLQQHSVALIRAIARFPFHSAMKHVLGFLGLDVGACRLPMRPLTDAEVASLREELERLNFFEDRAAGTAESRVEAAR